MFIPLEKISTIDPSEIKLPQFFQNDGNTLQGVKVLENKYILFDDIYIDDEYGNIARQNGQDPVHINSLKMSFAEGVDTSQAPPAVIKRKGTSKKSYELLYGYGRTFAVLELLNNKDGYIFTVIDCENESTEIDVKVCENEGLPKALNQEIDIKKAMSLKVQKGYIKNNEDDIRREVKRICAYRKKESIDRIVQMIFEDCNTPQRYAFYNDSKANLWIKNHSRENYELGAFNPDLNAYVYLVKEGYQYRFIMNAIRNGAKENVKSYCIVHCGSPTPKSTIVQKRKKFIEELEELTNYYKLVSKNGDVVWDILGFLPQEKDIDNWKELVKVK